MFDTLKLVVDGIQWTLDSDAEYEAVYPDRKTDWDLVHTCEILVYLGGPSAGTSCVNWTEGGTCDWCGRAVGFCPGHRSDGTLVTYNPPGYVPPARDVLEDLFAQLAAEG